MHVAYGLWRVLWCARPRSTVIQFNQYIQCSSDRINLNSLFHSIYFIVWKSAEFTAYPTPCSLWISVHEFIHLMFDFRHVSCVIVFSKNRPPFKPWKMNGVYCILYEASVLGSHHGCRCQIIFMKFCLSSNTHLSFLTFDLGGGDYEYHEI